ncbi:MAG: DUF1553 domain-containing protein [Bacteroidota bacterium]
MRAIFYLSLGGLLLLNGCAKEEMAHAIPDRPDFIYDVKPLLSDRCFACHGPDEEKQKAGLALHTAERAYAELDGKDGKFAIIPGDAENSEVYRRIISTNKDLVMPPPESHLSVAPHEIELLRRWIEQGAEYKPHWAFSAPKPVTPPEVKDEDWVAGPIDRFVLAKLEAQRLKPAATADRSTLLRRVTFDLTGLPPTPEELTAFLEDDSPEAYAKVVDRLLASPHYGERMATDWLDLSRYADSHGYQDDRPRSMWPWRDWVVRSFNNNLSYRDFVTWQLAGDLLPEPSYEQLLATGFNRNHAITQEGGVIEEEYLAEYASDRTHVFSTAFLGLTVECAKCHTHKYDPILHRDYYQLTAFFNNIKEAGKISMYELAPTPNLPVQDAGLEREIAEVEAYIQRLEATQRELEGTRLEAIPTAPNVAALLQKDLVAHYACDRNEGSRTFATVPEGETGWMNYKLPPTFADVEVVDGLRGKALRFDGENYVSLGLTGDFDHHQPFSASLWIRHNGRHRRTVALFGKRMDELRHNGYDLALTKDNKLAFRLAGFWWSPDQYPEELQALEVRSQGSVPTGSWQHVAVVYDGSGRADGVKLYIGARPQVQRTVVDNLGQATLLNGNHLALGNWNQRGRTRNGLTGFAGGSIDEFRLYGRMLSEVEIAWLADPAPAAAPGKASLAEAKWRQHHLLHDSPVYQRNLEVLDSLRAIDRSLPEVMVMAERDTHVTTFIRLRGEYDKPGDSVTVDVPSALPPLPAGAPRNRQGLAAWLFAPEHPLFARVSVNRLWQQFFGRGLVASPADFGNQGDLPSHPELLDYLALRYRELGWDTKALLREIVTSSTYQQAATVTPKLRELDPDNRLLARGPAGKLTAEMLRDQALTASGLLNDKVGGKWVKPYQPPGLWNEMASDIGEPVYRPSKGADLFRRSLYTYFKRTIPPPAMLTMDAAERAVCTVKRQETSTPLQSLVVMNAPLFTEASRHLAKNLLAEEDADLVEAAFRRIVTRAPETEEAEILEGLLADNTTYFREQPAAAREFLTVGTTPVEVGLDTTRLAAATVAITAIFNLDEAQRK